MKTTKEMCPKSIFQKPKAQPRCAPARGSAVDWKAVATETLDALRTFNAFYDDLSKSNPGFMGKLCLQDYGQWNEALLKSEVIMRKYKHLPNDKAQRPA